MGSGLSLASSTLGRQPWRWPGFVTTVLLALLTGAVEPVRASSDALAPAVVPGSWLLASTLPLPVEAGDVVIAGRGGAQWMGRVVRADRAAGTVVVARRNEPDRVFRQAEIVAWVVAVLH
jgi:hypothetical protein